MKVSENLYNNAFETRNNSPRSHESTVTIILHKITRSIAETFIKRCTHTHTHTHARVDVCVVEEREKQTVNVVRKSGVGS